MSELRTNLTDRIRATIAKIDAKPWKRTDEERQQFEAEAIMRAHVGPALDTLVARVRELEEENRQLRDTAAVARYVADHWREFTAGAGWAVATHPLGLVLAALNGETEPERLGLDEEDRAALARARDIAKKET